MLYVKELSTNKECQYDPSTNIVKVTTKNLMMPSGYQLEEFDYLSNRDLFSRPYKKRKL